MNATKAILAGLGIVFGAVGAVSASPPEPAKAEAPAVKSVSGPFTHGNLSIFLLHGADVLPGQTIFTLQEALAAEKAVVHETSQVNELAVENKSADAMVFIQSGDIVKGGKQDRSLTVSLLLPPHSERIPIASFCVEPGRWSQRGREDVQHFSSAAAAMPSREAKLAMKAPAATQTAAQRELASDPLRRSAAETSERQRRVWDYVASINRELSNNLSAAAVAMPVPNSLQTALENDKLKAAQQAYIDGLRPAGESDPDIIGYVFAVNGKLNSGDVYSSNALFRKLWPKLLAASATEAIAHRDTAAAATPSIEAVRAFVTTAQGGKASVTDLTKDARLETRETDEALYFATGWADGRWVHRNYLVK
jgi:hypothetical protein